MTAEEIRQLVTDGLPGCKAIVQGADKRFSLTVIFDGFEGMSPVKRQRQVYSLINTEIASGAIHAVEIQAVTNKQWEQLP